ncbi:ABC transporter permease [Desulfospira joergensenii]|uniref:ABC transporter permease n=1 Tax=Desulfospira joergensenii TaxID=53329 RepID=UPI0003B79D68|nr:ABC transporter permease [Desulfospira joergensenii]
MNTDMNSTGLVIDQEKETGVWPFLKYLGKLLIRDRLGMVGLIMFIIVVFSAVFAPWLSPYDPLKQHLRFAKDPPAWMEGGSIDHPLGTDNLGRDILSRIIYGTRVSLTVGFFGVLIASSLGIFIGLISGYVGGTADNIIMGGVNLILALPYLVFVVFIAAILGSSLINVILIFGLTDIPIFVRITRGEVIKMRESGFVESARSIGASDKRIIFRHILPNLIGPIITIATFEMSAMIFYEAGLGFLGLSVPPSIPSWGNMLAAGRKYLVIYPWIATFPGLAIIFTGLGMNLLGDWLRDVLDPKMRRIKK